LEKIELQESAYPFHDWNERITSECYAPNIASRIIGSDGQIVDIVNNYERMSYNFGPTLLTWLEEYAPEIYKNIIDSDKRASAMFSSHGAALAQCYNHMIMPLANSRNKRTQVIWGIKDFEHRFNRKAEGMWLPETAVDLETLDIMAEFGIKFTILSPHQARRVRKMDPVTNNWVNIGEQEIDVKVPYLCKLPSGRNISIFFYNVQISKDIAFNKLLENGEEFAKRLFSEFSTEQRESQLVHIANDGETYGHHHRFGEMALSFCQNYLEENGLAKLTVYGEFLGQHPPEYEVEILENTSWSCSHGVDRWRNDCGCNLGSHPSWNQAWRQPLRDALDWLRDTIKDIFVNTMEHLLIDCWESVDNYIEVILDRSQNNVETFLNKHKKCELSDEDKIRILMLLESQRQAMFMFTSCGWYFDDVSGIETIQILRHANCTIQLVQKATGENLEPQFQRLLENVPCNKKEFKNALNIYNELVKPLRLNLLDIGAQFAFISLFKDCSKIGKIFCYRIDLESMEHFEIGNHKLVLGKFSISSELTWEENKLYFAGLNFNNIDIIWGVDYLTSDDVFYKMYHELKNEFIKNKQFNLEYFANLINKYFEKNKYSLTDPQKNPSTVVAILEGLFKSLANIETTDDTLLYEKYQPIIWLLNNSQFKYPKEVAYNLGLILSSDLRKAVSDESLVLNGFERYLEKLKNWSIKLDKAGIGFLVGLRINSFIEKLDNKPRDISLLEKLVSMFTLQNKVPITYEYWKVHSIFYRIVNNYIPKINVDSKKGNSEAEKLLELYSKLAKNLGTQLATKDVV
jgi:alpha-amylase/alpha-mannosidase (GH57 family)